MTPRRTLYCDNPEEHGCGRRKAPAPLDLGYEATIIDLRARLAKEFERGYRQGRYEWQRDGRVDRFIADAGLGGDRPPPSACGVPDCTCDGKWRGW